MRKIAMIVWIMLVLLWLTGCNAPVISPNGGSSTSNAPSSSSPGASSTASTTLGTRTKTSGCVVRGPLPDPACTPGAIFPNTTKEQICQPGYARSVRDVRQSIKNQTYTEYGIKQRSPGQYEVDHLISLQLGGSNDIANLWPEAASPAPGFHEKDKVENYLHDQVCSGAISLKDAQIKIATNWIDIYNQMPRKPK